MIDGPIVTLGLAGIGGVVWLVRQEGRIGAHEAVDDERFRQTGASLGRIEAKVDKLVDRLLDEHD